MIFPRSSAELIKNTSTVLPTTAATVKDALDILGAASPGVLLTAQGQIIRRGASAPEAYQANTVNTFLGGNGTTVESRTAAQVLTSLGYEIGTFTPTMSFSTPGTSSFAYTTQTGSYVKIAQLWCVSVTLTVTPTIGTGTGNVQVAGFPFTFSGNAYMSLYQLSSAWVWGASQTMVAAVGASATAVAIFRGSGSGIAGATWTQANLTDGVSHTVLFGGTGRST